MLIVLTFATYSQTIIPGGEVSGTWNAAGSPYIIQGDVEILTSLLITSGVTVVFDSCYEFKVWGTLNVYGSASDSVIFTVSDTTGYFNNTHKGWKGISYEFEAMGGDFRFCKIEYAKASGIYFFETDTYGSIYDCIIQNCYGGIGMFYSSVDTIQNIVIKNNKGSAISKFYNCMPTTQLINFIIINNSGGIYGDETGRYNAENGIIRNNGYGIHLGLESYSSFHNVIIDNNGNFNNDGGGVKSKIAAGFDNCEITNNKARNGGGVYAYGFPFEKVTIDNCLIKNNIASQKGGGIYATKDGVRINNSTISDNIATDGAGFYYFYEDGHSTFFDNVVISNNVATCFGGGMYGEGGFVADFINTTITGNQAGIAGGGIFMVNAYYTTSTCMYNSIIWGNTPEEIIDSTNQLVITYSNINGGWPGTGNINTDPLFVSPYNKYYQLSWANFPLNDYTKSPCIDAGNPANDPDPDGTTVDMGAFFFDQSAQQSYSLDLTVFLEGPFFSYQMTPFLNALGYLPLSQPYFYEPINHAGNEFVAAIPNPDIVDWIFIEVRKHRDKFNPYPFAAKSRQAAFLLRDGSIVGMDGSSLPEFFTDDTDSLHVCLYHRNHIPVVSNFFLDTTNSIIVYNFSESVQQAIGGNHVQNQLAESIWGMIAADGNSDGQIDNSDKNELWILENGFMGYFKGDFDMNSQVDETDIHTKWNHNAGKGLSDIP